MAKKISGLDVLVIIDGELQRLRTLHKDVATARDIDAWFEEIGLDIETLLPLIRTFTMMSNRYGQELAFAFAIRTVWTIALKLGVENA